MSMTNRYHVNEARMAEIYREHPAQDRKKPYQIKQDELEARLKPRLIWDSSVRGTVVKKKQKKQ